MRWLARVVLFKIQKLLLLGMIVSLCFGAAGVWNGLRNSTPTVVTLTGNSADLPKHVTLKNVALGAMDAVTLTEYGEERAYVPIRAKTAQATDKVYLLLRTNEPQLLGLTKKSEGKTGDAESVRTIFGALAKIAAKTEVTGMTETDFNVSRRLKSALQKALPALHHDFVIINEGETPSIVRGVGLLALAGVLFVLLGISALAGGEKQVVPPPLQRAEPPPLTPRA